jgi:intergrase/recombinase
MLQYLKDIKGALPRRCYNVFAYATLTGLRPAEAFNSIRLIQSNSNGYYNEEKGILEHFKFKEIFLRRTKKAYISIVTPEILDYARNAEGSYNAIQKSLRRRNKETNMQYCRDIFATYLRDKGIPREIIDILQGRAPTTIFAKHYYRPDFDSYAEKIRALLPSIFC